MKCERCGGEHSDTWPVNHFVTLGHGEWLHEDVIRCLAILRTRLAESEGNLKLTKGLLASAEADLVRVKADERSARIALTDAQLKISRLTREVEKAQLEAGASEHARIDYRNAMKIADQERDEWEARAEKAERDHRREVQASTEARNILLSILGNLDRGLTTVSLRDQERIQVLLKPWLYCQGCKHRKTYHDERGCQACPCKAVVDEPAKLELTELCNSETRRVNAVVDECIKEVEWVREGAFEDMEIRKDPDEFIRSEAEYLICGLLIERLQAKKSKFLAQAGSLPEATGNEKLPEQAVSPTCPTCKGSGEEFIELSSWTDDLMKPDPDGQRPRFRSGVFRTCDACNGKGRTP